MKKKIKKLVNNFCDLYFNNFFVHSLLNSIGIVFNILNPLFFMAYVFAHYRLSNYSFAPIAVLYMGFNLYHYIFRLFRFTNEYFERLKKWSSDDSEDE